MSIVVDCGTSLWSIAANWCLAQEKRENLTKANGSGSMDDLSDKAFEIAKRRQAAATDAVALLEENYETTFKSHAATLMRAMAWLAGTSLYRSLGLSAELPPGSPVFSDQSNEERQKLLKAFMFLIERYGVEIKPDQLKADIPAEQKPRKGILEVQEEFQDRYNGIMKKYGFDYLDGGKAGAVACARLVRLHCQDRTDLTPQLAANTIAIGFTEGSKTVPAPLNE